MESLNLIPQEQNTIFFLQVDKENQEILKLCQNGDMLVAGRIIKTKYYENEKTKNYRRLPEYKIK